jgi:hypothetical protein
MKKSTVMKRTACLLFAWLALLLALAFAKASWFEATHLGAALDSAERDHIHAALRFIDAFAAEHGRFPDGEAFGAWAQSMDERGYRYGGSGFYLDAACARTGSDYCIGYWNGELWVTFQSGQPDKTAARIDGRAFDTCIHAAAALVLSMVAVCLFAQARRARVRPRRGT